LKRNNFDASCQRKSTMTFTIIHFIYKRYNDKMFKLKYTIIQSLTFRSLENFFRV